MVKLASKRHGPFLIEKMLGPITARLQLPHQWKIHPVFHTSLLTLYPKISEYGEHFSNPLPDIIDGEEEYEVDQIVDSRIRGKKHLEYLVCWMGLPDSENSWKLARHLKNAPERIAEFHNTYLQKP